MAVPVESGGWPGTAPRLSSLEVIWPGSRCTRGGGAATASAPSCSFKSRGLDFEEINLDDDPAFRQKLFDLTGAWTVPQIVIDGEPIGGYTELYRLDREHRLDERLAA